MSDRVLRVSFLGLGVMGFPMAGHLAGAGHSVTVYNRTPQKARQWLEKFGATGCGEHAVAATPSEAAKGADYVFACVGADADVMDITLGPDGAFARMKEGAVFVDHTTASAFCARSLATQAEMFGLGFLDAPVSGGQAGAEKGLLSIMCGGAQAHFDAAKPVMEAYGRTIIRIGEAGSGQTAKMANQLCIAGVLAGLSEALALAEKSGLDIEVLKSAISGGAAQSWQMDNRLSTMAERTFDFGFAVDWMRKDLGIVLDEAEKMGLNLPLAKQVDAAYARVQEQGGTRFDTSSLLLGWLEGEGKPS